MSLLPPQQQLDSPQAGVGRGSGGRGGAADSGALGPTFTPGRYCTQGKCVHKGPYGSLLHEAFGQGGGRGAEELPEGTLLEGTGPTPLRQQAGCLRGRMGHFSCWLVSCDAGHEEGSICHSLLIGVCPPTFCSAPAGRANSSLSNPSEEEACETPQLSGLEFRMLVNLDGEIGHLNFH